MGEEKKQDSSQPVQEEEVAERLLTKSKEAFTLGVELYNRPTEVPRVLFLGICLDFYYCLRRVLVPKFGFHFDRGSVSQALV
ncbi:hypothetical protein ACUY21_11825, partial [Corynebacterium marquesiae]